jgi:uncharacterized protein
MMKSKAVILSLLKSNKPNLQKFGIQAVGLFGSYAREEQGDFSDIDILVEFDPVQENFDNYMLAYDYFEKIFPDEKVELVTVNGLSPHVEPRILKEVLYV